MKTTSIQIKADEENNADVFWGNFDEAMPAIADKFRHADIVEVTAEQWSEIQRIEGFADGPAHAREALLVAE